MASPFQEVQQRGRALPGSPEGSDPNDPIPRCRPWKGLAIPCGLRLVLNHLGRSEYDIIIMKDY